jgi:predicted secreted protein
MKYFLYSNGTQTGPFEKDELLSHGLGRETFVWCQSMADWTRASQVADLADLVASLPPARPVMTDNIPSPPTFQQDVPQYTTPVSNGAQQAPQNSQQGYPMPKTWLVESILATLFCCLPFGIVGIIKASQVTTCFNAGDYIGAETASKDAKKWVIIAACCAIVLGFFYAILIFSGALASLQN